MVRPGRSPFWTKYGEGRYADEFREAEREAREAGRGLWRGAGLKGTTSQRRSTFQLPEQGECIPRSQCCRICSQSQACGDSCISVSYTCRKGRGCACDAWEVCR